MLNIENLIWVVPGIAGLLTYNRFLKLPYFRLRGWQYLFAIVFFATPYYFVEIILSNPSLGGLEKMSLELKKLFYSTVFSSLIGLLLVGTVNVIRGKKYFRTSTYSAFHDCCYSWNKKRVFITLRNQRIYLGILSGYTKDMESELAIKIIPLYSGYRNPSTHINWTFRYPVIDSALQTKMEGGENQPEIMIPYKEIVVFSRWSSSKEYKDAPQLSN